MNWDGRGGKRIKLKSCGCLMVGLKRDRRKYGLRKMKSRFLNPQKNRKSFYLHDGGKVDVRG
jgi:hypothetical protein